MTHQRGPGTPVMGRRSCPGDRAEQQSRGLRPDDVPVAPRGADASSSFNSMIDTARVNNPGRYGYLEWVFETASNLKSSQYEKLLLNADPLPPDEGATINKSTLVCRLKTTDGWENDTVRKETVEPVSGIITFVSDFRQLMLRGRDKVNIEWAGNPPVNTLYKRSDGLLIPINSPDIMVD